MGSIKEDDDMLFSVVKNAVEGGARVGRLALPKRRPADTPNFFGLTSRGAMPHITPDNVTKHTQLPGTYMALEDCKWLCELVTVRGQSTDLS